MMGLFKNIGTILADFWHRVHQHSDPADVYLAELDSLGQLEPGDALEIVAAIQDLLLRGEVPGPEDKTELLRSRLAELYSKFSAAQSQIQIAESEGLSIDTTDIERVETLLAQARTSLDYKMTKWRDEWTIAVDERFGRQGSPFFAVGGPPQPFINKTFGVDRIYFNLRNKVHSQLDALDGVVNGAKNTPWMTPQVHRAATEQLNEIADLIRQLYTDYSTAETEASRNITSFMNTFDRFLGMSNVTNLINQWTFGKIFMLIDKVVGNPIKWLAKLTKIGSTPNYGSELARLTELEGWAQEAKHVWAYHGYGEQLTKLQQNRSLVHLWTHGAPKIPLPAAPGPPTLSKEIVDYLKIYGKLPAGFTKGWPPELLEQASKLTRASMIIGVISTEVKIHAEDILNKAIPGGIQRFEKDTLQPYVDAGGRDIYGRIDAWLAENDTAIEEAIMDEVVRVAADTDIDINQSAIPSIEHAGEINEARRNAWIQRVLSYYKGIGEAREYAMLVQLFQLLGSERSNAENQEDLAWIDGLIGAAESWVTIVANEQGIHPELGVSRDTDEFQTQMGTGVE